MKYVKDFPFSMNDVAANAMLYMIAGYETSATTGQFAAYQLALNADIQAKARDEVVRVLAKYEGECTYEAQNEMVYLNMILDGKLLSKEKKIAMYKRNMNVFFSFYVLTYFVCEPPIPWYFKITTTKAITFLKGRQRINDASGGTGQVYYVFAYLPFKAKTFRTLYG